MARYALIIGIAEYTGSFNSLETPVQNANAIADILDQYGDFNQVRRLPFRREAGQQDLGRVIRKPLPSETLVRELQQFLQDAEGSDVLIYYSGHGFTKLDPLSLTPEGYLASSNCQIELNATGQITVEKNGISLFGLNALINQHTFSSLVVILDCCNSGAFLESSMVRRDVTAFDYQRDYYLITACRSSSKAYEGEEYSLLTTALLKGLSPENASPGSGRISGDRLFDVIGNELQNSRQEPIRLGWGRLITLVQYLQAPESAESVVHPFNAANPYMGLKPFEREQAAYFFGREQAVRALLDRLAVNRFLSVIGPSGCGKSSLVKAGLLAELESDRIPGSSEWWVEIIIPGQYPLQALTHALERHHSDDKPIVLFVDQFEELFTICSNEEEQRTFIKRLNEETSDPAKQTRIIIAMRGDFLDRCAKFQEAADLINSTAPTTYMVIPLTEAKLVEDLEESITCPAALHGVSFEQGLVSRILDDVINQPGAMPLLQYALMQLWDSCISPGGISRLLTIQSYDAIEGVKGALQRWADQFHASLSPTEQMFLRELVSELVQIGDGGEVTRRRTSWERLREIASSQEQLDRIIGCLVYQRLLVADDQTVEVAHEALLSESKLIQGWIEENRENIRLQQRLETYCREWQERDRSENYLLDAGRLAAIDEWMGKKQPHLMSVDQEFIEQSRERRDRQFQAQLEQERRLREAAEGRAIAEIEKTIEAEEREKEAMGRVKAEKRGKRLAIAAGILGVFALSLGSLVQLRQSEVKQQQFLTVGAMIGKAEQLLETHSELEALEASIEALGKLKEMGQENSSELQRIQKVILNVRERDRVEAHEGGVYGLSFSPDGKLLVSGGIDKDIKIWDMDRKSMSTLVQKHSEGIRTIKFSPDGNFFASGSFDKTVKIWNKKGDFIRSFDYGDFVLTVSFSSDNKKIAVSGANKGVVIWDIESGNRQVIDKKDFLNSVVQSLDFHPTLKTMLITTGDMKHDTILWNLSSGKPEAKYRADSVQKYTTMSVRFSPKGDMTASCDEGGVVKLRDLDGTLIGRVIGKGDNFHSLEFSPDGNFIAVIGSGDGIKIWKVSDLLSEVLKDGQSSLPPNEVIQVNTGAVNKASFQNYSASQGTTPTIASSDKSGTIRIWKIFDHRFEDQKYQDPSNLLTVGCAIVSQRSDQESESRKETLKICSY